MATTISTEQATDMLRAEGCAKDALPTTGTLTARLVRINDLTWSDERGAEIWQDLIEVRDGDLVLGEVWVESSEDEAPYAAAVAEFGDVTWL